MNSQTPFNITASPRKLINRSPFQRRRFMKIPSCMSIPAVSIFFAVQITSFAQSNYQSSVQSTRRETPTLTYSRDWEAKGGPSQLRNFHDWAEAYVAQSRATPNRQAVAEGVRLARERRIAIAELIKSDPEQAIANSVPTSIITKLPQEIAAELETHVSGTGDFSVVANLPAFGGPSVEPIQRFVKLGATVYRAYVYGRRVGQTTKIGIPLHGIAVDHVLALHEGAVREIESDAPATQSSVTADVGGTIYQLGSRQHLQNIESRFENAEAGIDPRPTRCRMEPMSCGALNTTLAVSCSI
jgi:hypothetical protein